jgi:hypothetical protein
MLGYGAVALCDFRATTVNPPAWPVVRGLGAGTHELEIVGYRCVAPRESLHAAGPYDARGRPVEPPKSAYFQEFTARKTVNVPP